MIQDRKKYLKCGRNKYLNRILVFVRTVDDVQEFDTFMQKNIYGNV